ncbi:TetR/AcrR family transcriptional regulator [Micromonospora sp. NPDC049903]|uniref:TetR/AcrR family transcriptional regulator n=1 Tax=Micromonospora sp. NPDC049903 TaxID=3364276 RepID=UPI0037BDB0C3
MSPGAPAASGRDAQGGRPLRADARRNRTRILDAADAVFAVKGPTASTEEIAQRAEVAIGTVFRHFPTKEALVEAVFVGRLDALAGQARSLAGAADPGAAFFAFLTEAVRQSTIKHTFADALADAGVDLRAHEGAVAEATRDLQQSIGELLGRAQQAARVRVDIDVRTLIALIAGAAHAIGYASQDPAIESGVLSVTFDGLRPPVSP